MKKISIFVIALLIPLNILANFPFDKYKNTALSVIVEFYENQKKEGIKIDYKYIPGHRYKSIVKYSGKFRDIPENRKYFMGLVKKTFNFNDGFVEVFTKEVLLIEDGKEYWAPVQKPLIPYMEKEIEVNNKFEVFFNLFGAVEGEYIFGVSEFNTKLLYSER